MYLGLASAGTLFIPGLNLITSGMLVGTLAGLGAGAVTGYGKKAFKYISSITNASTPTSTSVAIGFSDRFGYPLAVPYVGANVVTNLIAVDGLVDYGGASGKLSVKADALPALTGRLILALRAR